MTEAQGRGPRAGETARGPLPVVGLITSVLQRVLPLEGPYPLTADRLVAALGGRPSVTGKAVTPEGSLGIPAVYSCVRVLTDNVASLPLLLLRRLPGRGKERAVEHPLYALLHDSPNPYMTAYQFKETLMGHLLLWGNAYAEIVRDQSTGQVVALYPLRPNDMTTIAPSSAGPLIYTYRLPKSGRTVELRQDQVLHLRGLSHDGIRGYSPITLHREALGLTLAAEEYGARWFGNSAQPGGVLQAKTRLKPEALINLKNSWEEAHRGLEQSHRVAILEEGVEWKQVGLPPGDAQFMETRQFQLTEVSRLFRVPPHKISDLNRATYSNVDKQEQQFMLDCLRPWLVRWEQQISKDLLTQLERRDYFAEFLMDAQWRADIRTRYQAYAMGRQWGWLSANDVRDFEGMNPIADGGDEYLVPVNMTEAGSLGGTPMTPEPEAIRALLAEARESLDDERDGIMDRISDELEALLTVSRG